MPKKSPPSSTPKRQKLKRKDATDLSQTLLQPATFPLYVRTIRGAQGSLWNAVVTENGHPEPFYAALKIFGPLHLLNDWNTLLALQGIWAKARQGEEHAKKILQEVSEALSWIGQGQTSPLTDDQKDQRQNESSLTAHHKKRAAKAVKRAEARFLSEIKDLPRNDPGYPKRVRGIANDVATDEFSELGKETKALALADYCPFVKTFLTPLS